MAMLWQVDMVLDKLKEDRKIAAATHNIIAYRCDDDDDNYDDIGELTGEKIIMTDNSDHEHDEEK